VKNKYGIMEKCMYWEDNRDPVMVAQMQEKDRQIKRLQEENEALKEELDAICYELGMYHEEDDCEL